MKTQIVREAFTLGGEFYARGAEITDPKIIDLAQKEHRHHLLPTEADAAEAPEPETPKKTGTKAAPPAPEPAP